MSQTDQIVYEDQNEQFGFTQIPNVVLTSTVLSPTAVRIYGILRRYAGMPKGAMPSVPTICVEANISKATYNREIKTFIRSTENPNPSVPLITVIHRRNKTNVFKIHKLTDELIAKLKPAVMMEETELESLKEKYKKKKKRRSGSQNETPIENTRESQNETSQSGSQNETPGVSNCDTNNKENKQYRQQQQENVVVVINQFEKEFGIKISEKKAKNLIKLSKEHGKEIEDAIEETQAYYKQSKQPQKNPYGAVCYAITTGWDITEDKTENHAPSTPAHQEVDDKFFEELWGGVRV